MWMRILGGASGVAAASVVIAIVQKIGHSVYPPPEGLEPKDREAFRKKLGEYIASAPPGAFRFVLASYILGSLAGGTAAAAIAADMSPVLVVGGLLTLFGLVNLKMIPHPLWFSIASTLCYLPCAWLAGWLLLR